MLVRERHILALLVLHNVYAKLIVVGAENEQPGDSGGGARWYQSVHRGYEYVYDRVVLCSHEKHTHTHKQLQWLEPQDKSCLSASRRL